MDATVPATSPPRRRFPRWLRITTWIAVWLLTLLVLLIAIENWLGARAWQACFEESRAAGDNLEFESIIPPPVPDAENFAAIPLFKPLFDYDRATPGSGELVGALVWHDPAGKERMERRQAEAIRLKQSGDWQQGKFVNVVEWQKGLSKTAADDPSTPEAAARAVLQTLSEFDPELDALRAAESRPYSRFPLRYQDHIAMLLPHLPMLQTLAGKTQARAVAELTLGDVTAAHRDVLLGLRIARAADDEPLLISQIVTMRQLDVLLQPIWEGVTRHQWNDAQLAEIDAALARFDFLAGFHRAIRGERAFLAIQALDAIKKQPRHLFSIMDAKSEPSWLQRFASLLMPSGWIDFNKAHLCHYYGRLLQTINPEAHRFFPQETAKTMKDFDREIAARRYNPRKSLAAMAFLAAVMPQQRAAKSQTNADLARVAIAIERHRLKHGALPPRLSALVPQFLPKIPPDVTTGDPLHYQASPDGTFTLYSVGWNLRDDGGTIALNSSESPPTIKPAEGDWLWPRPATE